MPGRPPHPASVMFSGMDPPVFRPSMEGPGFGRPPRALRPPEAFMDRERERERDFLN